MFLYLFLLFFSFESFCNSTLRIPIVDKIKNLDPHQSTRTDVSKIIYQVFENLVEVEASGAIKPKLAESWIIDSKKNEIIFKIKGSRFFSNGEKLTSKIVNDSLFRSLEKGNQIRSQVKSVEVLGEDKIKIRLVNGNYSLFLRKLATHEGLVCLKVGGEFLGTGSYKVVEFKPGYTKLKRVKNFRKNSFEYIEYKLTDRKKLRSSFLKGDLDELITSDVPKGVKNSNNLIQYPYAGTLILTIGLQVPLEQRQRIFKNIRRGFFASSFKKENTRATSMIPFGMNGHNENKIIIDKKKKFKKVPRPITIGLVASALGSGGEEIIVKELERLGFKAVLDYDSFPNQLKKFKKGLIDLTFKVDSVHYFDPLSMFNPYYSLSNNNIHLLKDKLVDTLYQKAESENNPLEKKKLISSLEERLNELGLVVPLAHPKKYKILSKKINVKELKERAFMAWDYKYQDFTYSSNR